MDNPPQSIHILPRELIEHIFYLHVIVNLQSRKPLLFTCRTWYNIAITYGQLWGKIGFGVNPARRSNAIYCSKPETLVDIVQRAGAAKFALFLISVSFTPIQRIVERFGFIKTSIMLGCRSLTFFSRWPDLSKPSRSPLATLSLSCEMTALEELIIEHEQDQVAFEPMVEGIVRGAVTAPNLRTLRLTYTGVRYEPDEVISGIANAIFKYPHLLKGISTLQLSGIRAVVPWSALSSLNELTFAFSRRSPSLQGLDSTPITRLVLSGYYHQGSITAQIWTRLTHLTLSGRTNPIEVIQLTGLIYLCLIDWVYSCAYFHAPKLETLTIRVNPNTKLMMMYPRMENADLHPRIVNIDLQDIEEAFDDLDDGPYIIRKDLTIFTTPLPFWTKVEELRLRVIGSKSSLSPILPALSGSATEQCYPSLRCIEALYRTRISEAKRDSIVEGLKGVIEARVRNGGTVALEKVDIGWTGQSSMEWIDCLAPFEPYANRME